MTNTNKLGKIVRRLRKAKGLSQEKLARLTDVSNNTIVNIERGENLNPTATTLKKIAEALNISVDKLL